MPQMVVVQTGNPHDMDASGAWLLDRIALGRCAYYFCKSGGQSSKEATFSFLLRGGTKFVTLNVPVCRIHGERNRRII